MRSLNLEIFI